MNVYRYIFILLIFGFVVAYADNGFELMLETGGIWQNRNDVQIPPDSGTRFEIDKIDKGPFFHYRLEGYYRVFQKHALRVA